MWSWSTPRKAVGREVKERDEVGCIVLSKRSAVTVKQAEDTTDHVDAKTRTIASVSRFGVKKQRAIT
jgi:rRNA processing protein Krr1/Pno1